MAVRSFTPPASGKDGHLFAKRGAKGANSEHLPPEGQISHGLGGRADHCGGSLPSGLINGASPNTGATITATTTPYGLRTKLTGTHGSQRDASPDFQTPGSACCNNASGAETVSANCNRGTISKNSNGGDPTSPLQSAVSQSISRSTVTHVSRPTL